MHVTMTKRFQSIFRLGIQEIDVTTSNQNKAFTGTRKANPTNKS